MSSSSDSATPANPSPPIIGGLILVAALVILLVFFLIKFRNCPVQPADIIIRLYSENTLHWKSNLVCLLNVIFAFLIVPCSIHLSVCVNGHLSDACVWSLRDVEANVTFAKDVGLPAHGAVGFGLAALIIEMLLSVFVSIMSLRWYSEENGAHEEEGGHGHLRSEIEASAELANEWKFVTWLRRIGFGVGLWVLVIGLVARILVYSLFHSYHKEGLPALDTTGHGELICVMMFSFIHYFTYLGMCFKKTFSEHQDMNGDYAAFVCGTCSGAKVLGMSGEKCPSCSGVGHVFEVQNSHFSAPIQEEGFPVVSTK